MFIFLSRIHTTMISPGIRIPGTLYQSRRVDSGQYARSTENLGPEDKWRSGLDICALEWAGGNYHADQTPHAEPRHLHRLWRRDARLLGPQEGKTSSHLVGSPLWTRQRGSVPPPTAGECFQLLSGKVTNALLVVYKYFSIQFVFEVAIFKWNSDCLSLYPIVDVCKPQTNVI